MTTTDADKGMLERLARASDPIVWQAIDAGCSTQENRDRARSDSFARVRAVLEALRQPSEGMIEVGVFTNRLRSDIQGGSDSADRHWLECSFTSMIDHILSEHTEGEG